MSKLPLSSQSWKSCTSLCSSLQHSINPIKSPLFCLHNERHPRCPASNVIKDELGVLQNFLGTGGQKPNLRGETSGVMTYREQCEKAEHSAAGACTPCCCPYTPPGGVLEASIVARCHCCVAVGWSSLMVDTERVLQAPKASFSLTWPDTSRSVAAPRLSCSKSSSCSLIVFSILCCWGPQPRLYI